MKRKMTKLGFVLEDRLLTTLKRTIPLRIAPKRCSAVSTFLKLSVGTIVPDLVVVATVKGDRRRRVERRVPSLFECAVLSDLVRHGRRKPGQIARDLYVRESRLEQAFSRLEKLGLFCPRTKGALTACTRASLSEVKIISVEAKLRRWKDAIQQAKAYLRFSNASYVALPQLLAEGNGEIALICKAEGLGLIAVNSSHSRVLVRAKSFAPLTAERIWLIRKTAALKGARRVFPDRGSVRVPLSH